MPGFTAGRLKKLLAILFVFLAVVMLLFAFLPLLAEEIFLPRLLPAKVTEQYKVSIYRLGPQGVTFNISGYPDAEPLAAAANIRIDWTLSGLLERRLKLVSVDGLHLKIPFPDPEKGKTNLSGRTVPGGTGQVPRGNPARAFPPLLIDAISVVNSTIAVATQGREYILPLSLTGHLENETGLSREGLLRYSCGISLASLETTADIQYLPRPGKLSGTFKTVSDIGDLAADMRNLITLPDIVKGEAEAAVTVKAGLVPFFLDHLEGEVRVKGLSVGNRGVLFQEERQSSPAVLSFSVSPEKFTLEAKEFALVTPLRASLHLAAIASLGTGERGWQTHLQVRPAAGQEPVGEYTLAEAPQIEIDLAGEYGADKLRLEVDSTDQSGRGPGSLVVRQGTNRLQVGGLGIESDLQFSPQKSWNSLLGSFKVYGKDISVTSSGMFIRIPDLELDGNGLLDVRDIGGGSSVTAKLHFDDALLRMDQQDILLQGIAIDSPFAWPLQQKSETGILQIADIFMRNADLGGIRAEIKQLEEGVKLNGTLHSPLIPEGNVVFTSTVHPANSIQSVADLQFTLPETSVSTSNFNTLFPALGAFSGSGLLKMQGQGTVYRHRISGAFSLALKEGYIEMPEVQTRLEGIQLAVDFPDLPTLHSSPGQDFSIRSLRSKKIELTSIQSSFRLESPKSLLVEKISADWSGGRIFTGSFRLQKENPDIEVAVICDRLGLAEVLTELGLARAEGKGDVSGWIPLSYARGNIYVDHGFLFSTPGEKGSLKIVESEQLTEDIPRDVPHFSPILFAGAALKNFQYDWAKLLISSENENLLLQLKIDGKPAEKLPYRFDPQQNVFRRLGEDEIGGIDQPLKLDVNFNVPLNELLRYNKSLQSILQNTGK